MRRLLVAALPVLLAACATGQAPPPVASAPAPCPAPVTVPGNVFVRLFDGVLTLPPGYVFDGNAVGNKTLFQGQTGALRIGPRAELKTGYMDYARATLKARELRCGLEILRHGSDEPPLWLLLDKTHYALIYDQNPGRVPAIIDGYCASLTAPAGQ
ncbi:MAG: hypothetical protein ACOY6E_11985 [Pseudomonadota bacterium]